MNRQEVFNTVKNHLLTQGKKSELKPGVSRRPNSNNCAYRGMDNCKCAVGCLIPDDKYEKAFEGYGIKPTMHHYDDVTERLFALLPSTENSDLVFLQDLQEIHDGYAVEYWPEVLANFAKRYGLKND